MDHAKFCPATQGWSTPELVEPIALLRRRLLTKQEEDHAPPLGAMPLRRSRFAKL
jgi:hypothetical protein